MSIRYGHSQCDDPPDEVPRLRLWPGGLDSPGSDRPRFGRSPRPAVRRRRLAGARARVLCLVAVLVVVAVAAMWDPRVLGSSAPPPAPAPASAPELAATAPLSGAASIQAENAKPGNWEWRLPAGETRPPATEGFADRVSAQRGETVRLFVTSNTPTFEAVAYRLGNYGGAGARRVWSSGPTAGHAQPACTVHPGTLMVDCSNWAPTIDVPIGPDWPPGQYLFKLVPSSGASSVIPFVVRDDSSHSAVLVVSTVTTLQAYNDWGGHSYYTAAPSQILSFDRPLDVDWFHSPAQGDILNVAQLVESLGLDVTYTTNVDQHAHPELMRNHRAIVSGFHDEYYSPEMRSGMLAARDAGVNLAFLGANAVYRRIRLEPSPLGPHRHQVSYLWPDMDPLVEVDPEHVTTLWRWEPMARPESALVGTIYECDDADMRADMVIHDSSPWMFRGTRVRTGQRWPRAIGVEYDHVDPKMPTPSNLQVLAHSPLVCKGRAGYSDMTYYTAPSGAGVLSVGTVGFEHHLGPVCPVREVTPARWRCQVRKMIANVVTEFSLGPAGLRYPSQPNLDQFTTAAGVSLATALTP